MMMTKRWIRKTLAIALLTGTVVVGHAATSGPLPVVQAAGTLGSGGEYHPVTPQRIFDTRAPGINDTAPLGRKPAAPAAGLGFNVDVLGQGGIPAEVAGTNRDVLAVVLNVTVIGPTAGGYASLTPAGVAAGPSSLVNFNTGENVPNLAIVGPGAGGAVTVALSTYAGLANSDVAIDVFGWIAKTDFPDTADSGARFIPAGPGRILDTRSFPVPTGWPSGLAVPADGRLMLPIRGADAVLPNVADIVPNDANVTGVMVNITAVGGAQDTFVSATPDAVAAGAQPTTSNTNLRAGQVKANMAIVPVGADGNIYLYNAFGNTHLIVDVLGYLVKGMSTDSTTGRVVPLDAPFRVFDTRQAEFGSQPLGLNSAESWSFKDFTNSVTLGGASLGPQSALIGNLTGTDLRPALPGAPVNTYLTMYPGGLSLPVSSNINLIAGQAVPNTSLLRYGGDTVIQAYNYDGSVHYFLDVYAVVLA